MQTVSTSLPGVVVIEPAVFRDERGFFLESYHQQKYQAAGVAEVFVQDNHSRSVRGVLRGLHVQRTKPQGKLIRAIEGTVFDVAVDVRRGSPTLGQWVGVELSAENFKQLYIPPGFAHGFCVLSGVAQVEYKCTAFYDRADEVTIAWNDPDLAIQWPLAEPALSEKDRAGIALRAYRELA